MNVIHGGIWACNVQKMCGFIKKNIQNQSTVNQVETATLTVFKWIIIYNDFRFYTVACEDMYSFVLFLIKH